MRRSAGGCGAVRTCSRLRGNHGCGLRAGTSARRAEGNLTRLVRALKRLDARIRTDAVPDGLPFDTSPAALRGVLMLNLTTKFGDLDLTFTPSGTAGYPDLSERAEQRQIGR